MVKFGIEQIYGTRKEYINKMPTIKTIEDLKKVLDGAPSIEIAEYVVARRLFPGTNFAFSAQILCNAIELFQGQLIENNIHFLDWE